MTCLPHDKFEVKVRPRSLGPTEVVRSLVRRWWSCGLGTFRPPPFRLEIVLLLTSFYRRGRQVWEIQSRGWRCLDIKKQEPREGGWLEVYCFGEYVRAMFLEKRKEKEEEEKKKKSKNGPDFGKLGINGLLNNLEAERWSWTIWFIYSTIFCLEGGMEILKLVALSSCNF